MTSAPPTPVSLIAKIRDGANQEAWVDFVQLYTPLLLAYCQKHGVSGADAADLSQDVLLKVSTAVRAFELREAGRFSGWLLTITRNRIREVGRSLRPDRGSGRTTIVNVLREQPYGEDDDKTWHQAHQQRLVEWGAERVRPQFADATWRAFELTALENVPASDVAQKLGMTTGAVYVAKSRVLARIRDYIEQYGE